MSTEELSYNLVKDYRSLRLTITAYVIAILMPLLAVFFWYLIDNNYIKNKIPKNYTVSDFILVGSIWGYFFFFILASTDIINKMLRKIELDILVNKFEADKDLLPRIKKLYWLVIIFSILALIIISIGFASNKLGIFTFTRYKRKIAPPGVGPGIAEAHTLNF